MLKKGETKGYGGDSDRHCLFQIGNFGNIHTECWPQGEHLKKLESTLK